MSNFVRGGIIAAITVALLLVVGWQPAVRPSLVVRPVPGGLVPAPAGSRPLVAKATPDAKAVPALADLLARQTTPPRPRVFASALFADDEGGDADNAFARRRKAPSLDGGVAWINTGGPIDLKELRGKFVLLDFWTYCCINCMHILPVLKRLEHEFPNELVVIGVHSAKFEAEQDSKNITDAVLRYDIEHPVINDSNHKLWDKFEVSSWPSLRVIDPEGYVIAGHSGEIDFATLEAFFKKEIANYRKRGLVDETPVHFNREAERTADTPLRFPGKVLADPAHNRLFIADSGHNRIVIAKLDGTLIDTIGSGEVGSADGNYAKASFDHPQGMAVADDVLYVADTENHLLRRVDLKKHDVGTIAGTGKQATGRTEPGDPASKPRKTALSSPWALWIHGGELYIAMAGPHQIWRMKLPHGEIEVFAGSGREDIVDGPDRSAAFAQPSGLTGDDAWLYVADSEGSSIRAVPFDQNQDVATVIGTSQLPGGRLFTFGDVDGVAGQARLQHPLDVALAGGLLYVADTYNNKIKVIDLAGRTCRTLAGALQSGTGDDPARFDEPAGLSIADGRLYVADTNNQAIRIVDLTGNRVSTLSIAGLEVPKPKAAAPAKASFRGARPVKLPAAKVKAVGGQLRLHVDIQLPPEHKINDLAPLRYLVEAEDPSGLVKPEALGQLQKSDKHAAQFDIDLPLTSASGKTTLKVSCSFYYCREGTEGVCKAAAVTWTVPVEIAADAASDAVQLHFAELK